MFPPNSLAYILLVFILLGFSTACTGLMFRHFMTPGMVFNKYAIWLSSFDETIDYKPELQCDITMKEFLYACYHNIMHILRKPLGLCVYCNTTWLAIFVYWKIFGFSLFIFLYLGITWFFVYVMQLKLKI